MSTFKDLQDTIHNDYLHRNLGASTQRAIQRAIRKYEKRRHWFNEAHIAVATVANQSWIALPSDYFALDRIEVIINDTKVKLDEASFDKIQEYNALSTFTSQPHHYNYHEDRFEIAAIPDSAYPINIYYLKVLPSLSADTDSNVWTNECADLILHEATLDLMTNVVKTTDQIQINNQFAYLKAAQDQLAEQDAVRALTRLHNSEEDD